MDVLVSRPASIALRIREILDVILPPGRRSLLSASLSFLWLKSFSLSDRSNFRPRFINPDRLLSRSTSFVLQLGSFSRGSCFLLPSVCSEFGIRWRVHLRRVMRVLLSRGIDLLCPSARARCLFASCATVPISTSICLGARQ